MFEWAKAVVATLLLGAPGAQEPPRAGPIPPEPFPQGAPPQDSSPREVDWKEGVTIHVRVPVASPERQLMTAISFPEESIETAITGWGEGEITAVPRKGLLFLRLMKKSEGELNVIGSSGTHYLLHLSGRENPGPEAYDRYLKIRRAGAPEKGDPLAEVRLPRRREARPAGVLDWIRAMRLGLRPEGARILRAGGELAFESPELEIRLAWVYLGGSYRGLVYEIRNRSGACLAVDASRFRAQGGATLIISALRENVLEPGGTTRLYTVFWRTP